MAPSTVPVPDKSPANERRMGPRQRHARPDLVRPLAVAAGHNRQLFPARWFYLIAAVLIAVGGAAFSVQEAPSGTAAAQFAIALIALVAANFLQPYVHERYQVGRAIGVTVFVIAPLTLFGAGMTDWAANGPLDWDVAMVNMLLVSTIAAVYLRRHPGVMFAGQLAVWCAAVLDQGSIAGITAMGVGMMVAALVSIEQFRQDKREDREREVRERLQMRASEILSDYEETRQGWFWETDRRGLLTYISPPIASIMGTSPEQLIGQPLIGLFDLEATGKETERELKFHFSACSAFNELSMRAAIAERELWWSVSGRAYFDNFDNFIGFRGSGTDLTERHRSQERTTRLAAYDSLTGLANRHQMLQALDRILGARADVNRALAVMLLDLDRFKRVNDTMGHPAGDALLKQVAQRLEKAVGTLGRVGRLGGDEFKIIVPGQVEHDVLKALAEKIIRVLSHPYAIDGKHVVIGASIGITRSPEDGRTTAELIRNADLALYAAKDRGRGRYFFYADDLHAEVEERAEIESDLHGAIERGELSLYYQPVVDTATETIAGFEALLRWQHPTRGWIEPGRFVSIAEDSGLITEIGAWALDQACTDVAQWPPSVRVSVNISPLQFAGPAFPDIVADAIGKARIDPSRLELEITESVFLSDDDGVDATFALLKQLGVRLSLDDFGIGYSSLSYLKRAPFDKLKIDRSFVRGITEPGSHNGAIITSITSLAHALGMETTAEGVETMDELELVRMYGCSHVQGYVYQRPMTAAGAAARLASGLCAIARGPRKSRLPRQAQQRKVILRHEGKDHEVTVRNVSLSGAMVEGLWNVAAGTRFQIVLSAQETIGCVARWCEENRTGLEFDRRLERGEDGQILALEDKVATSQSVSGLRKTG